MKDMHTQPHWTCMHTCTDFSAVTIKNVNCQICTLTGDTFLLNGAPRRPLLLSGGGGDTGAGEAAEDDRRASGCSKCCAASLLQGGVLLYLKENKNLYQIKFQRNYHESVLRIRDVYPGSWFLPIPDPEYRIPDPKFREVWKTIFCWTFFCSHKFRNM